MKIPKVVQGLAGPIAVVVANSDINGEPDCLGLATYRTRTIQVRQCADESVMWTNFWHEVAHFALYDSGLHNRITEEEQEQLCDLFGSAIGRATHK
jgi:hypothetical protein